MSRSNGILRSVIERRKDQFYRIPWTFQLKDQPARKDKRIDELKAFFRKPDGKHTFQQWMYMLLDDRFVTDASTVYRGWRRRDGKPYVLEVLDGATVKPLIDDAGRIPDYPSPAYQQCYSDDTEILTRRGWLRRDQIDVSREEFATRNPVTKALEWQKSSGLVVRDYVGRMYRFSSRALDLLVTEDHRMLVDKVPHALKEHPDYRRGEGVITARELFTHRTGATSIPLTARWAGVPIAPKRFVGSDAHMTGDDFAAFMGAYLSEGSCNLSSGKVVAISQRRGGRAWTPYRDLLERIAPGRVAFRGDSFLISSKPLVDYLRQFGHAKDKWIPNEIMDATPEQLALFWTFFRLGDGDRSRDRMFTSSRRMADQLQEIALKLGHSASIRTQRARVSRIREGDVERVIHSGESYVVSVRTSDVAKVVSASTVTYSGKVWCPSVLNGIVYVRRNGLPAWCGNCIKGLPMVNFTEDELIYAPMRPSPALPIYGYCYSSDTEVLTRRGWLNFNDVRAEDEIATRNTDSKLFEWQRPLAITNEPYSGPMVGIKSRSVDLLVTPNHRVLLDSMPTSANGGKKRRGSTSEVVVEARHLLDNKSRNVKIPATSVWVGRKVADKVFALEPKSVVCERRYSGVPRTVVIPASSMAGKPVTMSGDDYCALMGAYLAEGNVRAGGGIEIAQRDFSKGYGPFGRLIANIMGSPAQHNGRAFVLPRRALTDHFRQFGHAHEKFVPQEIMDATPTQLRLFWDYFVLGDGCLDPRKNRSGRGSARRHGVRITTTSARLAGQLQEIAQKIGISASVSKKASPGRAVIFGKECEIRNSYTVIARYSEAYSFSAAQEHYTGTIHCVTVPNGIIYVRRNGKPSWCGNSEVEMIMLEATQAIRRCLYQVEFWNSGSIPDVWANTPNDWTPKQVAMFQALHDSLYAGNMSQKSRVRFMPGDVQPTPIKGSAGELLKSEYDEWLARIICFTFAISPQPFVKETNRATAETSKEAAEEEGLHPLMGWWKDAFMDRLVLEDFGYDDIEFVWTPKRDTDIAKQAQTLSIYVKSGIITVNEARDQLGLPEVPEGDTLIIETSTGGIPVAQAAEPPEPAAPEPAFGTPGTALAVSGGRAPGAAGSGARGTGRNGGAARGARRTARSGEEGDAAPKQRPQKAAVVKKNSLTPTPSSNDDWKSY